MSTDIGMRGPKPEKIIAEEHLTKETKFVRRCPEVERRRNGRIWVRGEVLVRTEKNARVIRIDQQGSQTFSRMTFPERHISEYKFS